MVKDDSIITPDDPIMKFTPTIGPVILRFNDHIIRGRIKYASNPFMCLIDEIKPFFGLVKQGTHWFRRGETVAIVVKDHKIYPTLKEFITNNCERPYQLSNQYPMLFELAREIYVFRLIAGVQTTNMSSIRVRCKDEYTLLGTKIDHIDLTQIKNEPMILPNHITVKYDPTSLNRIYYGVSVDEVNSIMPFDSAELSSEIVSSYFEFKSMGLVAQDMCRVRNHRQLDLFMISFGDHVYNIARRVGPGMIIYRAQMCQRILNLLDESLTDERIGVRGPPIT
jgi:hypothetical protein